MATVTGRVTDGDNPVTGAVVYFQPTKGPLAQAALDADGRYQLMTPGQGNGVAPGQYRVYLQTLPSEEEELAKANLKESDLVGRRIPKVATPKIPAEHAKYYSATTTDWIRDVQAGSNALDFNLKK
jgi:hypothetical protein